MLADDSAAVQKVVELTFADEGMEVVSVGDGQSALDQLEYLTPDVVLADAIMPGLTGYQLCRSMKDDQRFAQIPVMLLVSSFAPLDEAAAQRAGADDVITKPFQSIRQLVNRVDLLLSDKQPSVNSSSDQSKAAFDASDSDETLIPVEVEPDEPKVTVLVEAAQMEPVAAHGSEGGACAPDIEFQTADTAKLEPEAVGFRTEEYDTLEIEPPVDEAQLHTIRPIPPEIKSDTRMNETVSRNEPAPPRFSDALLDLDDSDFVASAIADDVVLDLDIEGPSPADSEERSQDLTPTQEPRSFEFEPAEAEPSAVAEPQADLAASPEEPHTETDARASAAEEAATGPLAYPPGVNFGQQELSPEAINAIARRVIEQMSDKVVREIAWEVVPELSELMIRKKLDQS